MNNFSPNQRRLVWAALGMVIAVILFAFTRQEMERRRSAETIPQSSPKDAPLPVYGQVPEFQLTNHLGQAVSLESYRGQVWLADIIFTRCPGPCAQMTERLRDLQSALPADPRLKLVSLTTDPEHDTPAVLAKYGQRYGADPQRWHFLTGDKRELMKLAVDGLKLTALDKDERERTSPNDLFIHSSSLVLVDQQGRMRASFQLIGMDSGEDGAAAPSFPWAETKAAIVKAVESALKE